jgi:hypothetical protein
MWLDNLAVVHARYSSPAAASAAARVAQRQ